MLLVEGTAELRGMEGDDLDVEAAGLGEDGLKQGAGEATAAKLWIDVKIQQIGTDGFDVQEVRGKVHEPHAGATDDAPLFRGQPAEVGRILEARFDPGEEGGLHRVHAGVVGLSSVDKHPAPLIGDEGGVFHGCRSNQCHGGSIGHRSGARGRMISGVGRVGRSAPVLPGRG